MYPQANRLRKKRDIEIVFENGRFCSGVMSVAKIWKIDPEKFSKRGYCRNELKFAVVVGKKVSSSAVRRNRFKRQMREVIRMLLKEEKIKTGFYVVFMAKSQIVGKEYREIEKDMRQILKKAKLLV